MFGRLAMLMAMGLAGALFCSAAPQSPSPTELYQAQSIVTGQREPERRLAFPDCLVDVLVKASGDPRLIDDPRVLQLKANAAWYVTSFQYHDLMAGIPVHDEQGTRDRPYDLTVGFEKQKIDAALRSLGLQPWAEPRPRLAAFLGIRNGPITYMLTNDGDRGLEQRLSLQAAAQKRGMPIVLPNVALEVARDLDFGRLLETDATPWRALSTQLGGDVPLLGTLTWVERELGWWAAWRLVWNGDHRWQIRAVTFDSAFRNAMEGSIQILSGHGEPN